MRILSNARAFTLSRHVAVPGSATLLACLGLSACNTDKLTQISTPDVVTPSSVQSASALPAIFGAGISEFTIAFQGSNGGAGGGSTGTGALEGQILYAGMLGDEFLLSDTFQTRRQMDARRIDIDLNNSNNETVYRQLDIARVATERAAAAYTAQLANIPAASLNGSLASQAESYALAGYTYIFFAEHYCGGVPFDTLNADGSVRYASASSTTDILNKASAKFDTATAIATRVGATATTQLSLATVGKARVLVDQGQYAAAAALVRSIPTTYVYQTTASTNTLRQNNGVWSFNRSQRRFSAADKEGTNGLPYRSDNDPRVLTVLGAGTSAALKIGQDGTTPFYTVVKYSEQAAPSTLASGVEARLIEAEAAFAGGNPAGMISILNTLRANTALYQCPSGITLTNFTCPTTTPTLAALTDPGTQLGRLQLLFKERAYWLYVTAHRLGDMRRLSRAGGGTAGGFVANGLSAYGDLTGGQASVYPVGVYPYSNPTSYGTNVSMPVPSSEESVNSLFSRAACNINTP